MATRGKGGHRREPSTNGVQPVEVIDPVDPGLRAVEHDQVLVAGRICDLKGCGQPGAAIIDLVVENYTGRRGDMLTLVICADHGANYQSGAIAGFAWAPVYKTELGILPGTTRPEPQKESNDG